MVVISRQCEVFESAVDGGRIMLDDPLRVLLVDDNPYDRGLVARELRKEDADLEILEAIDQQQLDSALASAAFDIVVTDYKLQWTDGLRVLAAVKTRHPHCPVIMYTGTGNEEIAVEAMKGGLDDYIIKTVKHLVRLRVAVRSALEHARTVHRAERLQVRLESLLSRLRIGVFRSTADGLLMERNAAFARIFGWDASGPPVEYPLRDLFVAPAEYEERQKKLLESGASQEFELEACPRGGGPIWVAVSQSLVKLGESEAVIEGLAEDVTHRRQMEETLSARDAELAHVARLSTLGEMVAGIAHEIRQPLHVIANYATGLRKRLEQGENDGHKFGEAVQHISEQVEVADDIVRRYRQFAERREPNLTQVDVNQVVSECVELLRFEMRKHAVSLCTQLAEPAPTLIADRTQIYQVVVNLLRNAYEAMQDAPAGEREIVLRTRQTENAVEVSVSDRGVGLPAAGIEKLCEAFVTTKPEGMGMGLAVSSRIVKAHRGHLWATSNDGQGATFHFSLPLAEREELVP